MILKRQSTYLTEVDIHTQFLCAIYLKGLFQFRTGEIPPKTHNLIYLLNKIETNPDKHILKFLVKLNEANISTRYPENMDQIQKY